ncbi:fatty-acid-binding protein 2 [Ricinus communis]|uniref:fatty-acid-binding protein 2 n=1 Tax=Ricinus communis TaxID=3988 RepID=UPI0007729293|nr:fatty-acid-binding protein 2 [Ricinus communis]XP_015572903.1 fatty-acid-binding protein 2 [Ricinus communis]XP_025012623.1 fatty-acid-binding protein 2 [Ricinus communis]|eukprot:XP_015572902.1 fatty-acid-binding protein 2 [Ricinus communis]
MRNNWLFFMNPDDGSPNILPIEPLLSQSLRGPLFSPLDNSLHQSRFLYIPGSLAFQEVLNCMSKLAGALLFWFTSTSSSSLSQQISGSQQGPGAGSSSQFTQVKNITLIRHNNLIGFPIGSSSQSESSSHVVFGKISSFMMRILSREAERLQSFPFLSLATALVPPFDRSSKVLAVPLENGEVQVHRSVDQMPCEVDHHGCSSLSFPDLNWRRQAVEPRTGIEFPMILDSILAAENKSSLSSEVLVGTGSRTMKIIKIKSLKVYAFGFYVHPNSVCEKLGPKYASVPAAELNNCRDFYEDLLREDIGMTVRLVINCNGMKINTVKDAFEKSLRNRLLKTNPDTDYSCLRTFGSFFTKDIPLPAGTTVDFRRTADGQLITEIGGNQIGAVHSKDLCRAFFDMYIGDIPVSEQTKEEIGKNVASMMRRC